VPPLAIAGVTEGPPRNYAAVIILASMSQVFISHSSKDKPWVDWIAREIEALGVHAYLAQHDPKPGEPLSEKVRREIAKSDVVVVLLTVNAYSSPYVQQEIRAATDQGKLIIPLVHPDIEGQSLAMLDGQEYIAFDFQGPPNGSADLISRVREIATQADERAQENAQKVRRERIFDGVIIAGLVLGVLYLAVHTPEGAGGLAVAT
jgi:hypothetical protein